MSSPRIALANDFLTAFSKLPKKIQKKVREFTEKFQRDPTQSGLNFERVESACDPKVRSVRIDQAYRIIVIHPPKGDVFVCVWVDHHDDAYSWARNRKFEINPRSGVFQIFEIEILPDSKPEIPEKVARAEKDLLAEIEDEDLLIAGIPEPLLAAVRALRTESDLDDLAPHVPSDSAEMLYLLAAGYSVADAIEEADRGRTDPESVDVEDFEKALDRPISQQKFKVVTDEADLDKMLDAPLEQWRIFLHPSQRKMVQMNANGPVRVLGSAGTGKTVVLMHRANYLASQVFTGDNDRLLVTTFTRNLAFDLKMNLKNLCADEAFSRLEVNNLHSWAAGYMRKQGHTFRIAKDFERRELFELAMTEAADQSRTLEFFMDEWDQVVQAQEVESRDEYFTARRVGRGTRLSRKQRADVWLVLSRYRELLSEGGMVEWPDAIRETRLYIEKQNLRLPYRAVLCDEVQDFSTSELKLLRTMAPQEPNTLYLVGDGHQRIYGQPVRLGACGIEIRGRSRRLKLNYRTTEQIRDRAVAILEGKEIDDLDGGVDSLKGYQSLRTGPEPEIRHFDGEAEEADYIVGKIRHWLDSGAPSQSICVAARTKSQISSRYEAIFKAHGIETQKVQTEPEKETQKPGVRLSTMHRMKGLEFSRVILVGVREGTVPLTVEDIDPHHELSERCLFYVASTRARDELVITGYGERSIFLSD